MKNEANKDQFDLKAFESAKANFEKDDDINRKIVRFSLNLMQDFFGNLTHPFYQSE